MEEERPLPVLAPTFWSQCVGLGLHDRALGAGLVSASGMLQTPSVFRASNFLLIPLHPHFHHALWWFYNNISFPQTDVGKYVSVYLRGDQGCGCIFLLNCHHWLCVLHHCRHHPQYQFGLSEVFLLFLFLDCFLGFIFASWFSLVCLWSLFFISAQPSNMASAPLCRNSLFLYDLSCHNESVCAPHPGEEMDTAGAFIQVFQVLKFSGCSSHWHWNVYSTLKSYFFFR